MNRVFKIVGRYKDTGDYQGYGQGKPGTQAKKKVYTSRADFVKHGGRLVERWSKPWVNYSIESFELINGEWESVRSPK